MLKIKSLIIIATISFFIFNFHPLAAQKEINKFDENKKRTGIWKKYYNNGRVRYVGQFENGKEVGTFKYYDISTSKYPTIIKEYLPKSDSAKVKFFTLRGKSRSEGMMVERNRVGKWRYYFTTGEIFSEEFYHDGNLEGELKNYYKNGKVLEHSQYQNGKLHGFSKKYSDTGILIEEVTYSNGILNGPGKYFELNGDLREEGIYRDGKRYGKWEFYIGGKKVSEKERKKENKFHKKDSYKQKES